MNGRGGARAEKATRAPPAFAMTHADTRPAPDRRHSRSLRAGLIAGGYLGALAALYAVFWIALPAVLGAVNARLPCDDPATLDTAVWVQCYLTNGVHVLFYSSIGTVLIILAVTAPLALAFGFAGAVASRAGLAPVRWLGRLYTAMVRGVPDIAFFLFFVVALDQGIEYLRHVASCPGWDEPIRQGANFLVCDAARTPQGNAPQWVHDAYNFGLAVFTYALVFGAFAANVLHGAMAAVPRAQLETAEAYGLSRAQVFRRILVPQMWIYALPGLSNLWMILVKATPLLFLLGIEDVVYWAQQLGASRTSAYDYPHPDWRVWYFLALLVFYLGLTRLSEVVLERLTLRAGRGQANLGSMAGARAA